ncbi:hypothetical protein [Hymenobacter baengnokdamensis]|uniref:hypothetical protein n=1 Tax=Hymenobacter baengnokdamensis TaxID=2615203 RepID=UPI001243D691|nr:hypothetical protein [Hymenobacter baengnokdamensis]
MTMHSETTHAGLVLAQLRITAVQPVASLNGRQAQVALADWLVAVVQAPAGQPNDWQRAFAVGATWPLTSFPANYVLLGYLDPRDLLAI